MILSAIAIILLGYAYCETLMRADGFWDGALINSAKIFGLVIVLCGGFLCLSCRIWLPSLSYYLEGELALFCIDAELRKLTNGEFGLDDLMVLLWKRHGIDTSEGDLQGLNWSRLSQGLRELGGEEIVQFTDNLVHNKVRPPIEDSADIYDMKIISNNKAQVENLGWLGLTFGKNNLKIKTIQKIIL